MKGEATRPRLGVALAGYVCSVVAAAVTGGMASALTGDAEGVVTMVSGQVGFWTVLVATVVYETPGKAAPIPERLGLRFRWIDVPIGTVVGVATQLLVLPALYLPFRSLIDDDLSAPARELFDGAGGVGLVVIAVCVIVIAPVVEELFFRGLLFRAISTRWGQLVAVVGSSVVFGATHFQPLQFAGLAVAGAVFATAVVRSGRLGTAIVVHAAFNATTFVAIALLA